jgi:DNA replication protein DnaC
MNTEMQPIADIWKNEPLRVALGTRLEKCEKHGEYQSTGNKFLKNREIWTGCPVCAEEQKEASRKAHEAQKVARQLENLEAMLNQAAIPARFVGRTFEGFVADTDAKELALKVAADYANDFENNFKDGKGLIFAGKPGTGKSHLAAAVLQTIMPKHCGLYVTAMGLIRMVRTTWRKDSERSEDEVLATLTTVPLLVIDEIGVQYGTDGEQTILFEVLDRRYCDVRPTILLTNQTKQGFRQYIGDRSYDRLFETCKWIVFDWESYRPIAKREAN